MNRFLSDLGWRNHSPWIWEHPEFSRDPIDLNRPPALNSLDREQHIVRESWRRVQFSRSLASGRRDAAHVRNAQYDEQRALVARRFFKVQNVHGRGVMTGAMVSDARYDVIRGLALQNCAWCGTPATLSWEHLAWFCR